MSNASKLPEQKVAVPEDAAKTASKAAFFTKSDHPKTFKDTIKLALNLFLNLFG
ncbi:MAG: hypothetical protein ABIN01_18990 [Ferruginibacter sp.]